METNAPADAGGQGGAPGVAAVAPAPTGAMTEQNNGTPALPGSNPYGWLGQTDEITTGYVQNKGWDNPTKVVESYRNLEKLLGADKANNAVIVPKADADPKEWGAIYDRLGRPTGPEGYKVQAPDGNDEAFVKEISGKFHELGLTKAQGEAMAGWFNEKYQAGVSSAQEQKTAALAADQTALRQEWGAAYTQNLAMAQTAARNLGIDGETIDKLSDALGHKATMSLLTKIGSGMDEDKFVSSGNNSGFNSAMTPAQAKAEIQSLMTDRDFVSKYTGGNKDARDRMAVLHSWAYPEQE